MLYSEYTKLLTQYVSDINLNKELNKSKLKDLALLRDYKTETLEWLGIVYVGETIDLMHPKYINELETFGLISKSQLIYKNRYIIPIKDVYGNVVGLTGYSNKSKRRYMYANGLYYNRRNTFYGLHNIDLIVKLGYALIVEGITDAIALYNLGYKNVLANCGTHKNRIGEDITQRLRYGVIILPDTDDAGQRAYTGWNFNRNKVKIEIGGHKDIDSYLYNASRTRVVNLVEAINKGLDVLKHNSAIGVSMEHILSI